MAGDGDPEREEPTFKVTDRRRFTLEGDERAAEAPEPPAPSDEPIARPSAKAPPSPRAEAKRPAQEAPRHDERPDDRAARHHGAAPEDPVTIDFSQFVLATARLAAMFLGDIPSPASGRPELNLAAAKQQIDLLGMLQEKTRGNLSREEEQLVQTLLTELRLRFVEVREAMAAHSKKRGA
jgi:hypothetical protein